MKTKINPKREQRHLVPKKGPPLGQVSVIEVFVNVLKKITYIQLDVLYRKIEKKYTLIMLIFPLKNVKVAIFDYVKIPLFGQKTAK